MGNKKSRPVSSDEQVAPAATTTDDATPQVKRPAVARGGGIEGGSTKGSKRFRRPRFEGSKRWTSLRLMGSSRWGSNQLLSTVVDRLCIWFITCAASILLIGDVMTFRYVLYDDSIIDNDVLLGYGGAAFIVSMVCLLFEIGANALYESQLVVGIIGFTLTSLGGASLLTIYFGTEERASVVIASLGLFFGGGALISDEVESVRKRLETVCGKVPNGTPGFLLVLASVTYVVVACVAVSKPLVATFDALPSTIGLQVASVVCAMSIFFTSCFLLAVGTELGPKQKHAQLFLTTLIAVATGLFPEASMTKSISVSLSLMSCLGFSSVCTLNLWNPEHGK